MALQHRLGVYAIAAAKFGAKAEAIADFALVMKFALITCLI